eukprot:6406292-Amphidinium_carterae.1
METAEEEARDTALEAGLEALAQEVPVLRTVVEVATKLKERWKRGKGFRARVDRCLRFLKELGE